MTDADRLRRMARALRESTTGAHGAPDDSRALILKACERRRKHTRLLIRVFSPLAAIFLLSSAWAASTPAGRIVLRALIERAFQAETSAGPAAGARPTPVALPSAPAMPMPEAERRELAGAPEYQEVPVPPATSSLGGHRSPAPDQKSPSRLRSRVAAAPSSAPPTEDPDNRLYEVAHQVHFHEDDAARALAAWDAYLAAMPNGRFSVEARYNRALCLVRLGRMREAREALLPFARGSFGSYRNTEARRILSLLGDD